MELFLPFEPHEWVIYGIPEDWTYITDMSVPGVGYNRYVVSTFGRIYDFKRQMKCPEHDYSGYRSVGLNTSDGYKSVLLHRIVIIEFQGFSKDPDKTIVNHKNGIKYCCLLDNLEWVNNSENIKHAIENNLLPSGENRPNAKMTNKEALVILKQLEEGVPLDIVAQSFPDSMTRVESSINSILNGKSWAKLARDNNIKFANYLNRKDKLSAEEKDKVGYLLNEGYSYIEILNELGYDTENMSKKLLKSYKNTLSRIKNGVTAPEIAEKYNLKRFNSRQGENSIYTIDEVHKICQILEDYGFISYDHIFSIVKPECRYMSKEERNRYVHALYAIRTKKIYPEITSLYNF